MGMTFKELESQAKNKGLSLCRYNPGGGYKYRIFEGTGKDWFDSHAIFATTGKPGDMMKAAIFLEGYTYGYSAAKNGA